MAVPEDISRVQLEARGGAEFERVVLSKTIDADSLKFPSRVELAAGAVEGEVKITASAWQGERLRTVAERFTTVPRDRQAFLEIPLHWLCDGFGAENAGAITTGCPERQACLGGSCADSFVDPATLPERDPASAGGNCLDVFTCFSDATPLELDLASCSAPFPSSVPVGLNVALVLPRGAGACTSHKCWIVVDGFSRAGWSKEGGRLKLPAAACAAIQNGEAQQAELTTTCPTKTTSVPVCSFRPPDPNSESPGSGGMAGTGGTGNGSGSEQPCPSGYHRCLGVCVSDLSIDSCGASCETCPSKENATATCDGSQCGFECAPGYRACGADCAPQNTSAECGPTCGPCSPPENASASCDGTSCVYRCNDGFLQCGDGCQPAASRAETCDNQDNDCNGAVDEDLTQACSSACGSGTETCSEGTWYGCTAPQPTAEVCDGADNDCDGSTDDGLTRNCSSACGSGTETCTNGSWGGCNAPAPSGEVCDGADNDCDGTIDEGLTRNCSSACGSGTETCTNGAWGGCNAPAPTSERCDLVDNDCDGSVDDLACEHTVLCYLFNDNYADMAGPYDAVRVAGSNILCAADGSCRRWFGRCVAQAAAGDQHTHDVTFALANDGGADRTPQSDALFWNGAEFCKPGEPVEICRKWIVASTSSVEQGHSHVVGTRVFGNGYVNMSATGDVYGQSLGASVPAPVCTADGTCQTWLGRWQPL
jgi:hypothetical protein